MVSLKAVFLGVLSAAVSARVHAYESDWVPTDGTLKQTSFDGKTLCGVDWHGRIFCADDNLDTTPNWQQVAGGLKWVAVAGSELWGVNDNDEIWFGRNQVMPNWIQMNGRLKQISSDGTTICGVSALNEAFCADQGIRSAAPEWRQLPIKLMNIHVKNGVVYGTAPDTTIWVGKTDGSPFSKVDGWLSQIVFDGSTLCGVNVLNEAWCADSNLRTFPNWRKLPLWFTNVAVSNGRLFATRTNGIIFHKWLVTPPTKFGPWKAPQGLLTQLEYDGENVCGISTNQDIWCASQNFDTLPNWRLVPGKLAQMALWGDTIIGLDSNNAILAGNSTGDSNWRKIPGFLRSLSTDGKSVCGTTVNNDIWCSQVDPQFSKDWRLVNGKMTQVVVTNGVLYGVSPSSDLFTGRVRGDFEWKQLPGKVRSVSFDGYALCVTTVSGDIWCADDGLQVGNPNWALVEGKLSGMGEYNAGRLAGLVANGQVSLRTDM